MAVRIKTPAEIEKMRIAGRLAAEVLEKIAPYVEAGITTGELDRICHDHIVTKQQAIPACLGYGGGRGVPPYPKSICTSLNDVVCHGIPSDGKTLKKGDILNIDVTVIKDGYHGDTSNMFCVGEVQPAAKRLIEVTHESTLKGIELVKPGTHIGDIGHAIQQHAENNYYSVVRDYCGHGIGSQFHEEPQIVHIGPPGRGVELQEGMTFTIEPMINLGTFQCKVKRDGWTVVTKDRKLSAQFEHTVLVTRDGVEVLTRRTHEVFPWES